MKKTTNQVLEILKDRVYYQERLLDSLFEEDNNLNGLTLERVRLENIKNNMSACYKANYMKILCLTLIELIEEENKEMCCGFDVEIPISFEINNIEKFIHSQNTISTSTNQFYNLCSIWELQVKIEFQKFLKQIIK